MTLNERNAVFLTDEFTGKVRIALCDWLNYWAVNGTAEIEDPDLREMTDGFIRISVFSLESIVRRLAVLVISEPVVKNAVEVTDANVQAAITNILSHSLSYLL